MNRTFLPILVLAAITAASHGAIVLGNLPQSDFLDTSTISFSGQQKAVSFIMSAGQDYTLVNVTLWISGLDVPTATSDNPDVYLAANNGGNPGARIATLVDPIPTGSSQRLNSWTSPANVTLQAGQQYWLIVGETRANWSWLIDDTTGGISSEIGASLGGFRVSNDLGATWSGSGLQNSFQITAVPSNPVPETSTGALLMAGCAIASLRRRWR